MKTLIVYYSFTANNELLAMYLKRRLDCDVLKIEELSPRTKFTILFDRVFNRVPRIKSFNLSLESYTNMIFISPVWAGAIATPLKSFLRQQQQHINRYSFITVCGGKPGQREKIVDELMMLTCQEPEKVTELWISDLVPSEKREDIEFIGKFKLTEIEIGKFESKIGEFLNACEEVSAC